MKILTLLIAGMLVFALCACGQTETVVLPVEKTPVVTPAYEEPAAVEESTEDIPVYVVNIYYGDENAENIIYEGIVINELSPQILMDKLTEKGVLPEKLGVNSFAVDNYNVIHMDVGSELLDMLGSTGTAGEHIMIGSITNTVLDAFDADALELTVNGAVPESGHVIYDFKLEFYN